MADILDFNGTTTLDLMPDKVLEGALTTKLRGVFILGETEDGEMYVASSYGDQRETLWLIEQFKHKLFAGDFE